MSLSESKPTIPLQSGQDSHKDEGTLVQTPTSATRPITLISAYPEVIGPFRVLEKIGSGGMGIVLKAEDPHLDRIVAIKILQPHLYDEESRKRFLREARLTASIEHPNIVPIYQVGEEQGMPYLAMQFLRGETLESLLQREGKLPSHRIQSIVKEIADGLAAAHTKGLIHRDIKPSNIWIDQRGSVKILDFGLARAIEGMSDLSQTGVVMGTPAYMAPEQARGGNTDHRADLFSLGSVLYRMATGKSPFDGHSPLSTMMSVVSDQPTDPLTFTPDLSPSLVSLIQRLMAKKPEERFSTAQEVVDELAHPGTHPLPDARTAILVSGVNSQLLDSKTEKTLPLAKKTIPLRIWIALGLVLIGGIATLIATTSNGEENNPPPKKSQPVQTEEVKPDPKKEEYDFFKEMMEKKFRDKKAKGFLKDQLPFLPKNKKGPPPRVDQRSSTTFSKFHALLVGVNEYEHLDEIDQTTHPSHAENDATLLAKVCHDRGMLHEHIDVLTASFPKNDPHFASSNAIRTELKRLAYELKSDDSLLFAFSGYEIQLPGKSEYYLCGHSSSRHIPTSMISLSEIYDILKPCKAKNKILVLDCSRAKEGKGANAALPPPDPPKGFTILFACQSGQQSGTLDNEFGGNGLLTFTFFQALSGHADLNEDETITWSELIDFTKKTVAYVARENLQIDQHPCVLGEVPDLPYRWTPGH